MIVGGTSSTHPGMIDKKSLARSFKRIAEVDSLGYARKHINMKVKQYNWRQKKYISAFTKAKKLKKPFIFLTHNVPYNTRLDKITSKDAPKAARGKHYGSFLERQMINRFKPDLVICGHMHENFGKQKLGKTLVVNVGSTFHGDYVLIDFNEKTKKFKVELKKL